MAIGLSVFDKVTEMDALLKALHKQMIGHLLAQSFRL